MPIKTSFFFKATVLLLMLPILGCQAAKAPPLPDETALVSVPEQGRFVSASPPLSFFYPVAMSLEEHREDASLQLRLSSLDKSFMEISVKALAKPIDLDALGHALIRVDQNQLAEESGAGNFSAYIETQLAGKAALEYSFIQNDRPGKRILMPVAEYMYLVTMVGSPGHKDHPFSDVLASIQLPANSDAGPVASASTPTSIATDNSREAVLESIWSLCPYRMEGAKGVIAERLRQAPEDAVWILLDAELRVVQSIAFRQQNRLFPEQDFKQLLQRVQAVSASAPDTAQVHRVLGLLLMQTGNMSEARKSLEKARSEDIGPFSLLALIFWYGPVASDVDPLLHAMEAGHPQLPALWLYRAWLATSRGDSQVAENAYRRVLQEDPRNTAALIGLGRLEMDAPSTRILAAERFSQAVKVNPKDDVALYNLALIWLRQGKNDEALRYAQQLVDAYPDDAEAWILRGQVLRAQEEDLEAAQSFRRAIQIAPNLSVAFFNLGALCAEQLNDRNCAMEAFTEFLRLEPEGGRSRQVREWMQKN